MFKSIIRPVFFTKCLNFIKFGCVKFSKYVFVVMIYVSYDCFGKVGRPGGFFYCLLEHGFSCLKRSWIVWQLSEDIYPMICDELMCE